jgi:succinate dehydrogenase / fumarate reductase cytochrome b subunit
MRRFITLYRSTIGKKIIMSVTGLLFIGFVIAHMIGNLQIFVGQDKFDGYAAMLHGPLGDALWALRIILFVAVILHITMAGQLARRARAARPVGYHKRDPQVSTLASRTMRWGGVLIAAFIVFHILHFTIGAIDPAHAFNRADAMGRHDIYGNVVASFRIWWVSLLYVVSMIVLGFHLWHGAWSSPRSLGVAHPSEHPRRRRLSAIIAIGVSVGFILVPVAVFTGLVH